MSGNCDSFRRERRSRAVPATTGYQLDGSHPRCISLFLPAVIALLVSAASGCGPKYPECETDKHCQEHKELCVDKVCRQCRDDQNCIDLTGDLCRECGPDNTCVKEVDCCYSDMDCPVPDKCVKADGDDVGRCGNRCTKTIQCPSGQECVEGICTKPKGGSKDSPETGPDSCRKGRKWDGTKCVWKCELRTIYFDFDENELTGEARTALEANLACAKELAVPLRIVGHTDERGTDEYNLALGERRAWAARKFLVDAGLTVTIQTLSYGEEMPACVGKGEECFSQNRRAEFVIAP